MKTDTKLVYLGRKGAKKHWTINSPATQTTTINFPTYKDFLYADTLDSDFENQMKPNTLTYGREGSDITYELANMISELENADATIITSTGASALSVALTAFVSQGDHIILTESCYMVAQNVCTKFLKKFGVEYTIVSPSIDKEIEKYIKPKTKVIHFESPASKTFQIQEIDEISKVAKKHNIITIFDNTWGGPLCFKPLEHGIDISVQSCSKYIDGHSDSFLGAISMKKQHYKTIYSCFRYLVPNAAHYNVYLTLRGIRTMSIRMKQHFKSGMKIAKWLEKRKEVLEILYPPLPSSPYHKRWKKYFKSGTGLMGIVLNKQYTVEQLSSMLDKLKYFALGYSWGCYQSVITAGDLSSSTEYSKYGKNTYMRIYIGLEDPEDLIEDLKQGFSRLKKNK